MANLYSFAKSLVAAFAVSAPLLCYSGNIPQYQFSLDGTPYTEISDGTDISCSWSSEGTITIFPNGVETPNALNSQGFPIGFDYKFGGQTFDQFVVTSSGNVYLGKGSVDYGGDAFRIGMSPIMHGLYRANISYKTEGSEGSRICTIQFKNAILKESTTNKGKYSLQIRIYEADGKAEIAFSELETLYQSNGFDTGISGWDNEDGLQLTGKTINPNNPSKPITVSSKTRANMLEADSYINWDSDDYDKYYKPVFVFTPVSDTTAPSGVPGLDVTQSGSVLNVSATRADGSDATVVLYSESPFTDADMPVDGETFRAGAKFGNATTLYYGNKDNMSLEITGAQPGKTYYVRALSVNGYPAYNRTNPAEKVFATTQAAPSALRITPQSTTSISFDVNASDNVIVAATSEKLSGYQKGYVGTFGTPSVDAKVGDEIAGGGKVVYVGQPGSSTIDCGENRMMYLRAWTVRNGVLSATSIDAAGVPTPTFPYEPGIENYPTGVALQGWTATDNQFMPLPRAYKGDMAIVAKTGVDDNGKQIEVSLTSPSLPLDTSVKLTFDFAMETARDASATEDSSVAIPQGSDPGKFGDTGYLQIYGGNTLYKTVNSYSGTMVSAGSGTNEDGSSSYESVEVDMAAVGNDGYISFRFSVPSFSTLYIKNIKIERTGEVPQAPADAPTDLAVDEDRSGIVYLNCKKGADAEYTLVILSEKPFSTTELPEDGKVYSVGSKLGNATVLYYGTDENIECNSALYMPGVDPIYTDYDTDYYVRAVSASGNPLYNRESMADMTYHTLADMGYPQNLTASFGDNGIVVTAERYSTAEGTILILTDGEPFKGSLEDGKEYAIGESVGNGKVFYRGNDANIEAETSDFTPGSECVITGYSYNPRGWYGDVSRTVEIKTSGIESIAVEDIDFANAEVYTVTGIKLNVSSIYKLPAGIYIVNGKKLVISTNK